MSAGELFDTIVGYGLLGLLASAALGLLFGADPGEDPDNPDRRA